MGRAADLPVTLKWPIWLFFSCFGFQCNLIHGWLTDGRRLRQLTGHFFRVNKRNWTPKSKQRSRSAQEVSKRSSRFRMTTKKELQATGSHCLMSHTRQSMHSANQQTKESTNSVSALAWLCRYCAHIREVAWLCNYIERGSGRGKEMLFRASRLSRLKQCSSRASESFSLLTMGCLRYVTVPKWAAAHMWGGVCREIFNANKA